jgi:hypothetical protein
MAQTTKAAASPSTACGQFVQQFYDWYLAKENALSKDPSADSSLEVALREKQSQFSPELIKALQEDLAAAKKSPDEIVGLDFDPIQNAQDNPERYVVGEVRPKGDHFWVEVFGIWEGKKGAKPDVVPELFSENGKWIFTNFHYPESDNPVNENLLSVLQALKKEREQPPK